MRLQKTHWPIRPLFIWLIFGLVAILAAEARPPQIFEFSDSKGEVSWSRLENRELRVDFSTDNPQLPTSAILREGDLVLAGPESGAEGFWIDRVNDEMVSGGTATYVFPGPERPDAVLGLIAETSDGLTLKRSIRIVPEGANLEVKYRLINTRPKTLPYRYSLETAWNPGSGGGMNWIHLPRTNEITRFQAAVNQEEIHVPGGEFDEAWYCVDSPEMGLGMFLVADRPFHEWNAAPPVGGTRRIEAVLAEGSLKPGEWVEGTYWISVVKGIGIPISAGSKYIAGLVWKENPSNGSYCLESRLIGMPHSLKKMRIFSAVGEPGSMFKAVPKYRRRSRLSNTEVVSVPLPTFTQKGGVVEVEQSLYSSSENLGYWKVHLKTPELLLSSASPFGIYDAHLLPGVEPLHLPQPPSFLPPREPVTPEQVSEQLQEIERDLQQKKREEISNTKNEAGQMPDLQEATPADIWEGTGYVLDLTSQNFTDDEEAALLAIESEWVFVDQEEK
ncbi:MAG: hypothetical protein KC931_09985 [Candidatus Omnitrophica bacterium]|nr:hypothetical protein [Candidatus Omnitrophota bacterium]